MTMHTLSSTLILVTVDPRAGHIDIIPVGYSQRAMPTLLESIGYGIEEGFVRDLPGCDLRTMWTGDDDSPASMAYLHSPDTFEPIGIRIVRGVDWCELDEVVGYLREGDFKVVVSK